MRAPLCSESAEICPEDQGIGSEGESNCEIQAIEKSFERCHSSKTAIFGICLDNLMGTTPQVAPQIPFILTRLCRYIEEHGLHCKHLFLEGDEKELVESLKIEFIESGDAPLETAGDAASAAKLLIMFFQELPHPLIPAKSQPDFIRDMEKLSLNTANCVTHLKKSVNRLPDSSYHVLKYLSRFLLRVAAHKERNGMSSDSLSLIFGPIIFRSSSNDPVSLSNGKKVVNYFVKNYYAIFEDNQNGSPVEEEICKQNLNSNSSDVNHRLQIPCPSAVMPVMTLMPLSVVIPPVESDISNNDKTEESVPILLIERSHDGVPKTTEGKLLGLDAVAKENNVINRKRKERRLSGEDSQQRSSSEERPTAASLTSVEKTDLMRRCSSNEEMKEARDAVDIKIESLMYDDHGNDAQSLNSNTSDSSCAFNKKSHSPHPPNAKRREVESNSSKQSNYGYTAHAWMNPNQHNVPENRISFDSSVMEDNLKVNSEQNSIAEIEVHSLMECDTVETGKEGGLLDNNNEHLDNHETRIPRSSSCPIPMADNNNNSEEESSSLSMSWSMLFESGDSEPLRSEHRFSWPMTKDSQEDTALLSPSVQSLRKSNSYSEAPLSPSAYRSYLSYRNTHLDASVPPSPPVEQEDFAKNLGESNAVSDSIKQLTKKIHNIKKRVRKFDEKFESDFGYKPSHAEKANHPEAKKLMNDLHKARKELKALKEESHLEQVSPASWHSSKSSHILGDTTNQVNVDINKDKIKPSVVETYGIAMKNLTDERRLSKRPDSVEEMTTDQVKEEKFAIQRALLDFESIHGKPSTRSERNTIRPLYDRYRNVKKLLVRSGSFPGALCKNKDVCSELQPILEHETMDFTSPQQRTDVEVVVQTEDTTQPVSEPPTETLKTAYSFNDPKSSHLLTKYDNSNIHELPLSEMVYQLQQVKSQKRHLRKILRDFESEFFNLNGRKVQKEDKAPVDAIYGEYKHVKARLKLLEALISKHDQHQLM